MGAVTALSLMNGFENGSFAPKEELTRGQAAAILKNVWDYTKAQEEIEPTAPPIVIPERPQEEKAPERIPVQTTIPNRIVSGITVSDIHPTSVILKWKETSGAISYDILDGERFLCNVTEPRAVVKGLAPNTTYGLQVVARFASGVASNPGKAQSFTTINSEDEKYQVLKEDLRGAFDYLWNEGNTDPNSRGYGIIRDNNREETKNYGSIAATGFALAVIPVGVEQGYITWEEGYQRAVGTLRTFYQQVPNEHGFFPHFVRVTNGTPFEGVEISIIDSSLFLAGAITAGEYFQNEAKELTQKIYERIDWEWYRKKLNNRFYMGYRDEKFSGEWNTCAEQFLQYVLGSGSDTYPVNGDMFYDINRWEEEYGGIRYRRSWDNSLFQYQFSHAFIDFRGTQDREGVDWYENSKKATLGHRQYCIDNPMGWKTYNENSWGLTACYTYEGYKGGLGALPNEAQGNMTPTQNRDNGTIAPYGAVASVPFTPEESTAAANYYKETYPELWGIYGFKESYSLDAPDGPFFGDVYYGINKGIEALQIANFLDGTVWEYFMKNENVQKGMEIIEVK